jgi:formylglycine-generating enzyme required for sulfatase activity
LHYQVRLPDEFEWQQAATRGDPVNVYPWGEGWDARLCNSFESHLNRTTLVGLYPAGTWRVEGRTGPLDMAGNPWGWCANKREAPNEAGVDALGEDRVVRGGSWGYDLGFLRSAYRGCSATARTNSGAGSAPSSRAWRVTG